MLMYTKALTENTAAQCREIYDTGSSQGPLWKKYTLTVREAAQYFHIGEKKIRQLVEEDRTQSFVLMVGNRAMVKRKQFEAFIDRAESL